MVTQYVEKDHRAWDEHIPAFQFAFNTALHDATGYTPAFLNYGRELRGPEDTNQLTAEHDAPDNLRRKLTEAYELVRIQLAQAFQRQKHHYDLRRRPWKPSIGEWVWKRDHPLSKKSEAYNAKLAPKFSGPYEIKQIVSPVIVDLRSKRGKWIRHVHVQYLKAAHVNNNNFIPPDDDTDSEPEVANIQATLPSEQPSDMEQQNSEILADIEALLREYEAGTTGDAVRNMEPEPQRTAATPTPARPPKAGTVIQRPDHTNRRKQEAFLAPPPPPPTARAQRPDARPPRPIQPMRRQHRATYVVATDGTAAATAYPHRSGTRGHRGGSTLRGICIPQIQAADSSRTVDLTIYT